MGVSREHLSVCLPVSVRVSEYVYKYLFLQLSISYLSISLRTTLLVSSFTRDLKTKVQAQKVYE